LFENGKWSYCKVSDGSFSKLGAWGLTFLKT
jgi:hypothetical protein